MKSTLSTAAVAVGLVLLLLSFAWGSLFSASSGWTEEKSLRMGELKGRAHILVAQVAAAKEKPNMHGGSNAAELEVEFEKVRAELNELADELEGRIEAPQTTAKIIRYAGIAFVVAGGLVVYASKG
jgi:uncharacterized protein YjeT (DUF2065 family)